MAHVSELIEKDIDAYLEAHTDAAPPIRRYLIENRDDAERALKARALDAAAGAATE